MTPQSTGGDANAMMSLLRDKHIKYLLKSLKQMPSWLPLRMAETNRLHLLFFVVSGLDLLDSLQTLLPQSELDNIIDAIYSFQVDVSKIGTWSSEQRESDCNLQKPEHCSSRQGSQAQLNDNDNDNDNDQKPRHQTAEIVDNHEGRVGHAGFRATCVIQDGHPVDTGNIAMTYCALASLIILGDDLSRVDAKSIIEGMRHLQLPDGSFQHTVLGGESDMRVVYCACAVAHLLNDWSGINIDRCCQFIMNSLSYEGAFGQCPGAEAHGGSTYCALASLTLMNKLDNCVTLEQKHEIARWCLNKYSHGFSGRPNKDQDTCYSFWVGASLVMLDHFKFIDHDDLARFILSAQEEDGGVSKVPEFYPDLLHTYLSLVGLTFIEPDVANKYNISLLDMEVTLNISQRAMKANKSVWGTTNPSSS